MRVADSAVASKWIDIACGHFYPINVATMEADAKVAAEHGKAYVVDEYAWTDLGATKAMLAAIEADPNISGRLYWSLLPHLENGTPEPHQDGWALWDPATDARGLCSPPTPRS